MPRNEVMQHLLDGKNIALITSRLTKGETFAHAQITDKPSEVICMSGKTSNNGFVFPLWLLPEHDSLDPAKNVRHPNLDPRYLLALADALGVGTTLPFGLPAGVTPEDIFHFIYAVLHAPTYRSRYAEYLRSDFPRIPLPPDMAGFRALADLGGKLVELHLLRDATLDAGAPAFPVAGSGVVEKVRFEASAPLTPTPLPQAGEGFKATGAQGAPGGRVWINKTQYFSGIDPETWAFRVGGYQVLEKWMKDRKGRTLGVDDIVHYRRVAVALARTRGLMQQVDECAAPLWAGAPEGAVA
jgi:hypothetical protein